MKNRLSLWLRVLFLLSFIAYIIFNENRYLALVRGELALIENARIQQKFIRLHERRDELLYRIILSAHRLPTGEPGQMGMMSGSEKLVVIELGEE